MKQTNSVDEPALLALFDAYPPAPPPALTNDALRTKAAAVLQSDGAGPYIAFIRNWDTIHQSRHATP